MSHRRINGESFRVVGVLVPRQATEDRLAKQGSDRVLSVRARPPFPKQLACHRGQIESIVEFAIGQQARITGHLGAVKFELQSTVENHSKGVFSAFTHWILQTSVSECS